MTRDPFFDSVWLHRLLGWPFTAADLAEPITIEPDRDGAGVVKGLALRCGPIIVAVDGRERTLELVAPGVPLSEANRHYAKAVSHLRGMGVVAE